MSESKFVCMPDAIPSALRAAHFALAEDLFRVRASLQEDLPDGFAVHFPASAYDDVVRFVGNERKCCPAISFEIAVAPEDGGVILKLQGPEGARAFLEAELPLK